MAIQVALHHRTHYQYDRLVTMGPQIVRLRPAPHCRTRVLSYSLRIAPEPHFLNWQQDPHSNYQARLVFPEPTDHFTVEVDLLADMTVINPFDFFVEDAAENFPFEYDEDLQRDLRPFLRCEEVHPRLAEYLTEVDTESRRITSFLVDINQKLQHDIQYLIRMEPGVQSPEETLEKRSGSCRDSAWLLVQMLRHFGLAARFVSGYLIQLVPDQKPIEGPEGPAEDFTDLHAWTEVYLPGAGWVGLDPTSGLFAGEGHLPLCATPVPQTAAPISGGLGPCEVEFDFTMSLERIEEYPRVTKPYTAAEWSAIDATGLVVDRLLADGDVRLTMGGEPTFVSIDDMEGAEWTTGAVGHQKRLMSIELIGRLRQRLAPGGLLHFGQGKWYPGESLPRWAFTCMWRTDGEPIWKNPELLTSVEDASVPATDATAAGQFMGVLAENLGVQTRWIRPAYEDVWHLIAEEQKLPIDVNPRDFDLDDSEDRRRLARVLEQGVGTPVGYVLPLTRAWWQARPRWTSGEWPLRTERLFLIPGDSPIGLRLPMDSLPAGGSARRGVLYTLDPFAGRPSLPGYEELRRTTRFRDSGNETATTQTMQTHGLKPPERDSTSPVGGASGTVSTAMCIEPRDGRLHVFMPPVGTLEDYLELLATVEQTAEQLQQPVIIEGYLPPVDHRLEMIKVTPDPGVIEVNIHPAHDWNQLRDTTVALYEEARLTRLGTEKFQLDGRHSGTGGGNHIVLGAACPDDSPFLRRPDLLASLVAYWNNHPSLSYVFSGLFVGPTSQAPRVDEGRRDALYELDLAMQQVAAARYTPPWLVDRQFRHLLVDLTGNTHRAEFCIDKLYSPDSATGRLGLVELRAFEMPPHPEMSLTQQLLVRALVALFWNRPYQEPLVRWNTELHDRWMLPWFLEQDLREVLADLRDANVEMEPEWFAPHLEFRCPRIGEITWAGQSLSLRQAIEPWYVLGEEPGGGGTTRFVDSSVERMEILVDGFRPERYAVTCNGREVPLRATGIEGQLIAGLRYRAWQPPSCLHPTIGVNTPLTFDIVDRQHQRSVAGCRYHVDHPGGLNPPSFPVNALEAESRRAARFVRMGHTGGSMAVQRNPPTAEYAYTLDLRR